MEIHGIGKDAADRSRLVVELLGKVGLEETAMGKYPHEFSGGQRQRIAIARCLTLKPEVLICDESSPHSMYLCKRKFSIFCKICRRIQNELHLYASHDLAVVKYMSDQVMVMRDGEVVEFANSDEIYLNPKQEYTRKLLASVPKGRAARLDG
jgi:peptide/nickel transport system ATP-binding protein